MAQYQMCCSMKCRSKPSSISKVHSLLIIVLCSLEEMFGSIYSRTSLMWPWTPGDQTKSVHKSEVPVVVKLILPSGQSNSKNQWVGGKVTLSI